MVGGIEIGTGWGNSERGGQSKSLYMGGMVKTWLLAFPREYVFLISSWSSQGYTWRTGCRYSEDPRVAIWACRSLKGKLPGELSGETEATRTGKEQL